MSPTRIEAAGGVAWRRNGRGVEVALVHRPKYDDWSLPKGKLLPGEHALLAAVREVAEETGMTTRLGRPLGEVNYLRDGAPKRVRYWAMPVTGGEFTPNSEVDQVLWCTPERAAQILDADRDRPIVARFASDPRSSWPLVVVRHGSAGERAYWRGVDRVRPLDAVGEAQSAALVDILDVFDCERVLSADVQRCLETVSPYADKRRLTIESEPLFSEAGAQTNAEAGAERLVDAAARGVPTVVCSQRGAMLDLVPRLCELLGCPAPSDVSTRKGGFWVFQLAARVGGGVDLVSVERFEPLA